MTPILLRRPEDALHDYVEARVEELENQKIREETELKSNAFGPWVLVARKRKASKNVSKVVRPVATSRSPF